MAIVLPAKSYKIEKDALERTKHRFSGGALGGVFRVASIQAAQRLTHPRQPRACNNLEKSHDTQSNRKQADQSRSAPVIVQIHRRQRERSTLQTPQAALNHKCFTIDPYGLFH
ncbi:MAG: hypothetical protein D6735_00950 [Acidobacteria bacterium]|nr:MAG: hypothetical protein D6735_00950 [Acidobacteriota bacterium]